MDNAISKVLYSEEEIEKILFNELNIDNPKSITFTIFRVKQVINNKSQGVIMFCRNCGNEMDEHASDQPDFIGNRVPFGCAIVTPSF